MVQDGWSWSPQQLCNEKCKRLICTQVGEKSDQDYHPQQSLLPFLKVWYFHLYLYSYLHLNIFPIDDCEEGFGWLMETIFVFVYQYICICICIWIYFQLMTAEKVLGDWWRLPVTASLPACMTRCYSRPKYPKYFCGFVQIGTVKNKKTKTQLSGFT